MALVLLLHFRPLYEANFTYSLQFSRPRTHALYKPLLE